MRSSCDRVASALSPVQADKPKEAIDMYVHQQDWANATRVAETSEPASMPEVLAAQGRALIERSEFTKAEALFVKAKKPELAVKAYKEAGRWNDATRIAREFLPHKVGELMAEHNAYMSGASAPGGEHQLMMAGRELEEGREFSKARAPPRRCCGGARVAVEAAVAVGTKVTRRPCLRRSTRTSSSRRTARRTTTSPRRCGRTR